jgi:hypothetical protein
VIAIQSESRLEVLREMALLLERENRRLHERIQQLTLTLAGCRVRMEPLPCSWSSRL